MLLEAALEWQSELQCLHMHSWPHQKRTHNGWRDVDSETQRLRIFRYQMLKTETWLKCSEY